MEVKEAGGGKCALAAGDQTARHLTWAAPRTKARREATEREAELGKRLLGAKEDLAVVEGLNERMHEELCAQQAEATMQALLPSNAQWTFAWRNCVSANQRPAVGSGTAPSRCSCAQGLG